MRSPTVSWFICQQRMKPVTEVYLLMEAVTDGISGSNEKLDEKAPDIIGLEYKSETKLDYAKYFKIYHYDKDVTLLEIDMTKDTDKDPEKLKEETATKDSEKQVQN